jgi:cytochrome c-type biogenesis protein CcmE
MSSERRRRTVVIVLSLAVAVAVLGYLAFGGIGENLVYYWSPTELLDAGDRAVGASIRLGGLVAADSIAREAGSGLTFFVTDGSNTVQVRSQAVPPAMFREGIGVVVEGTMTEGGTFETQRLMVKHDNEYQAPESGDDRDIEELMETMQFEAQTG